MLIKTTGRGGYLDPATGAAGGSSAPTVSAVNADAILAVWDSEGGTDPCGPPEIGRPFALAPTVEVAPTVAVAYDFGWLLLGRDTLPSAFTVADWRDGATVVVPPTRCARSHASNGVAQPEVLHLFRFYVWAISANSAGVAPAVAVTCMGRVTSL